MKKRTVLGRTLFAILFIFPIPLISRGGPGMASGQQGRFWRNQGIADHALVDFRRQTRLASEFLDQPLPLGDWRLIGWNDLGMHCMDGIDYGVFSILPPFNTIHAQIVIPSSAPAYPTEGVVVTYQAMRDPSGSVNRFSYSKTNFWDFAQALFGVPLVPDMGLGNFPMPGILNRAIAMVYDNQQGWYSAVGIPLTPYDDAGIKNYYPMLRLAVRDKTGNLLAATEIVTPVSDELDCRGCHASGSGGNAMPRDGWVNDPNPQRDYKLNILRLHDERETGTRYGMLLNTAGYHPGGLLATVTLSHMPILCARCHPSNALPGTGLAGVSPLTQALHQLHGTVIDPVTGIPLNNMSDRSTCYRCHPGSTTRCLRGVMGAAVNANGQLAIQCQDCHGSMQAVGRPDRQGWLDEPNCQNCHTGTAINNSGQLRYTSVFVGDSRRTPADLTFATNGDVPSAGLSLYRFSKGHGGLFCEACHGSTHAEFPSTHLNDNVQSIRLQGHLGVLAECESCHGMQPNTVSGGPHGLHPLGQSWIDAHARAADDGGHTGCAACHGLDYRGTVLSKSQADRSLTTRFGLKQFPRGFQIGCYDCHNGPQGD